MKTSSDKHDHKKGKDSNREKNKSWFDVLPEELIRSAITSYFSPLDKVKLALAYKENFQIYRMLQSEYRASLIRDHVAKGRQNAAKLLLDKYKFEQTESTLNTQTIFTTNPLLLEGSFTDYSGRTFTCTAYEYAYWAKDRHMLRMLEAQMDEPTKASISARIDKLEQQGLTYTQHEETINSSKHFDITPLKKAYEDYIRIHTEWEQADYSDEGTAALKKAFINIGKAQRDLPAHYVNEYFRKDRSFYPKPEFHEETLPRELIFDNCITEKIERIFPLALTDSSGLGVDFVFIRAGGHLCPRVGIQATTSVWACLIDLATFIHLDNVRTNDLEQSRKNLEPSGPSPGKSF